MTVFSNWIALRKPAKKKRQKLGFIYYKYYLKFVNNPNFFDKKSINFLLKMSMIKTENLTNFTFQDA